MSRNDDERAAGRAECFARLVLAGQQDAHGRSLLDHAERLTERLAMYWEKEVGWLSASLGTDRVDETTLTGVGFNIQQVRHATVVKPRTGESPGDYAERIAMYNEPDALAVATAMLEDAAAINPAVPIETTDAARRDAIERLGHAMEQWYEDNQQAKPPPGGGMADGRPTAPGLSAALLRMRHHTRMALLSLDEDVAGAEQPALGHHRAARRPRRPRVHRRCVRSAATRRRGRRRDVGGNTGPGDARRPAGSESSARRPPDRPAGNQRDRLGHRANRHAGPRLATTRGRQRRRDPLSDEKMCPRVWSTLAHCRACPACRWGLAS